jgi:hypothetical protein
MDIVDSIVMAGAAAAETAAYLQIHREPESIDDVLVTAGAERELAHA